MNIASLSFAGFAGLVLVVYYLLPRRRQNILLLIASYLFYVAWSPRFLFVLLGLTAFSYLITPRLEKTSGHSRQWLWFGISVNLLVLAWFKYSDFFVPELLSFLSSIGLNNLPGGAIQILLPVGLSFYVLQAIAYLVDVHRGQVEPSPGSIDLALYLAYFPKLTAGPIERPKPFLTALAQERRIDGDALAGGVCLVLVGLVRKVVIADPILGSIPGELLNDPGQFSGAQLVFWLVTYGVGLYNDFAGYSNIVRGLSRMFGIELTRNFAIPFAARNYNEFWNRWHISLSTWLRDYVFFPVSRALMRRSFNRYNAVNLVLPPLITMIASGLWHGGSWNLILWGALMGAYQVIERLVSIGRPVVPGLVIPWWRSGLGRLIMIASLLFAAPLFLMPVPQAWDAWVVITDWQDWWRIEDPRIRIALLFIPSFWIDWVQYRSARELVFLDWPRLVQSSLMALAILAIFLFSRGEVVEPFVYQGF